MSKRKMLLIVLITIALSGNSLFAQSNGTCAKFTGDNYWLDAGTQNYTGNFAIEMWVYKSSWSVTADEVFVSNTESGGYTLKIEYNGGDSRIAFVYRNSTNNGYHGIYYSISGMSAGWHHIAATHSTDDADLYVDGINTDGVGSTITYSNSGTNLLIGAEPNSSSQPTGQYFDGYIDEIRIWERNLSPSELSVWRHKSITSFHAPSYVSSLSAYYKMDTEAAGWGGGWLDDASNNVGGSSTENDLSNSSSATTSTSNAAFADFPSGYTTDAEALWGANGTNWANESSGLSLQAHTPTSFAANYFCIYANNGLNGTTTDDLPSNSKERASRIWFNYDYYSGNAQSINLKFDISDFGADGIYDSERPTSEYLLLKRSGTTGDFAGVKAASSINGDEITFENYAPNGDAYYTIGIYSRITYTKSYVTTFFDGVRSIYPADIDNDGDMDILAGATICDDVAWFENDGSENFTEITIDDNYLDPISVFVADIDGDGDMDVVAGSSGSNTIDWWENDGSENFSKHTVSSFNVSSLYVVDIDGDGDLDVVAASSSYNDIAWWSNNGSGVFSAKHTIDSQFSGARSVYAADFDNDGDMDVVAVASNENGSWANINWYENNGSEDFSGHTLSTSFYKANSVCAMDLDSDGDMDILVAAENSSDTSSDIVWWENIGSGSFSENIITSTFNDVYSVYAADIEGDGDMDIVATTMGDAAIYYNDGSENFSKNILDAYIYYTYSVSATDIDSDGDYELITSNGTDDDINYYRHNTAPTKTTTFTDGSSYTPSVTVGQSNQAIGRFYLNSSETFSFVKAELKLNGTRTGVSDFRLWQSSDATFNSGTDIQLGSMVEFDPGTGNTIVFEKEFISPISTSGTYYFLTCDVASNATGSIEPILVSNTSLKYSGGTLDGSISNAPLSDGDTPLPVTLSSFTGIFENNLPTLYWETESESDNMGWNIYRAISSNLGQAFILNINTVPGNGTTTEPSYYSFIDEYEVQDNFTYWYWLESISASGDTEMFGPVALTIPLDNNYIQEIPMATELYQNFPNPFNPNTSISFDIKEGETGVLSIYNIKGQLIVAKEFETGNHSYTWDARERSSGIYLYKLKTNSYSKLIKMLLVK